MKALVLREGVLRLRAQQTRQGLVDDARRQVAVDPERRVVKAPGQDDLSYVVRSGAVPPGARAAPARVA